MSRRALLRTVLGVSISLVSIWILWNSVDVPQAIDTLRTAAPAWVALMFVLVLVDVGARGGRWRALLSPIAPLPYRRVLGYTYQGYLANNVLPARLGELFRSHQLGEGEGISRTTVLGTVVVERVVDTVMVVAIAAVAVLVLSVRGVLSNAVLLGAAFVTILVIGLAIAMALHRLPGADRVTAFFERWPRAVDLARRLREGLAVAARPRALSVALLLSAVAWTASITTFIASGRSIGVELSLAQGALLCTGVALSTIVPSGPGYVGSFELVAVTILGGFGVDRETAFAIALLVHVMLLAVTSIGGVIALFVLRGRHAAAPTPGADAADGAASADGAEGAAKRSADPEVTAPTR